MFYGETSVVLPERALHLVHPPRSAAGQGTDHGSRQPGIPRIRCRSEPEAAAAGASRAEVMRYCDMLLLWPRARCPHHLPTFCSPSLACRVSRGAPYRNCACPLLHGCSQPSTCRRRSSRLAALTTCPRVPPAIGALWAMRMSAAKRACLCATNED